MTLMGRKKGATRADLEGRDVRTRGKKKAGRLSNTVYLHSSPRLLCVCVHLCVSSKLADERKTVFKMGPWTA